MTNTHDNKHILWIVLRANTCYTTDEWNRQWTSTWTIVGYVLIKAHNGDWMLDSGNFHEVYSCNFAFSTVTAAEIKILTLYSPKSRAHRY